ncbi:MAG: hypothetical protein KME50_14300 [Nostoc desertorum CM1-VF14]|jgi:hypothetical protein|nr:hypothetical protein [Nostoc desertorum CM1-VF14]
MGHWALGMGHWALGIGHWAWGMGHGAWGVGYGALVINSSPTASPTPYILKDGQYTQK